MFHSHMTKSLKLVVGLVTFSYLANISIHQSSLTINPVQASSVEYCGPDNSAAGRNATKFFLYPFGSTFDPACKKHDRCYGELTTNGKTKEQCESEFKRDLYALCEDRSLSQKISQDLFGMITNPKLWGIGLTGACKRQADYAAWAVGRFGESALQSAKQAVYSIKVVKVEATRINDRLNDDELKVCVSVLNDGNLATEWDLVLLNKKGRIVDTEPDTYERNIKVGQTDRECVSTRGTTSSISDLGSQARVVVRIDHMPDASAFFPIANIRVDTNRPKDKPTPVAYKYPSPQDGYKEIVKIKSQTQNSQTQNSPRQNSITGVWNSSYGPISFQQSGSDVLASYPQGNGAIEGRMFSNVLTGYWTQDTSSSRCSTARNGRYDWGKIRFSFNASSFAGLWSYCDDEPTSSWTGSRQ